MPGDGGRFVRDRNIIEAHYLVDAVRGALSLKTADAFFPGLFHIGFAAVLTATLSSQAEIHS
jgi:hypothetical protein